VPELRESLGAGLEPVVEALRSRAPVFLRVNLGKTDVPGAMAALLAEGIGTRRKQIAPTYDR